MLSKEELRKRVKLLDRNSKLVTGPDSLKDGHFRLNFNEYANKEIESLGFKTADGCIFVHTYGINGIDYNSSGFGEIDYKVTDRDAVQTVLAYAESKGFPIGKNLAEKAGYEVGTFVPKKEEFKEFSSDDEAVEYAEKKHTLQQTQVLSFINNFCSDAGQRISACDSRDVIDGISSFYRAGWCYYFATILKTAFGRGKVCWMAPFSHVAWEDTDGTVYDVEGIYAGEAFYAIPEEYCGLHMLGFLHSPAYPEKNHYSSKEELIGIIKSYCEISGETYDNKIENWFMEG